MRLSVLAVLLLLASPVRGQDQIDLHQAVIHDSPLDVADWPVTVRLTRIVDNPQPDGINFETTTIPDNWQMRPSNFGGSGPCSSAGQPVVEGCIQYTIWAVANINGQWHAAGFIQMWRDRFPSGGTLLQLAAGTPATNRSNFHANWAYACDRWGALCIYDPRPGDKMGFFITAGNARDFRDVSSVRERSQVVVLTVAANDTVDLSFPAGPPNPPPPPPTPDPPPPPPITPGVDLTPRVQSLEAAMGLLVRQLAALGVQVQALVAKPIPASCSAGAVVFGQRINISCRLN